MTIKGAPAKGGRISFDPTSADHPTPPSRSTEIGKDGTYGLKTWVGENRVTVDSPGTQASPALATPYRSM